MEKFAKIKSNQKELIKGDGTVVFFSYSTPVVVFTPTGETLVTTTKYSVTTSRHINEALRRRGAPRRADVAQEVINSYI